MKYFISFCIFNISFVTVYSLSLKTSYPKFTTDSPLGIYEKGAVTSNGWECAGIGTSILKKGGSAVDAAIATLICDGVSAFPSMGLGGGFTMVIYDATHNKTEFLNAREMAPAAATKNMFNGDPLQTLRGGQAVAIPGEVMGYWEAHKKYGKIPWRELFEPSIELCENGVNVTSIVQYQLKDVERHIRNVGDTVKRPEFAKTLKRLATSSNPVDLFYKEMAENFVKEIQEAGGIVTKEDFESYRAKWDKPIKAELEDMTVFTSKPPGSGALLVFMLNVLKRLIKDVEDERILWQRMIETFKWGYARRSELGDPDSPTIKDQVENLLKDLLSEEYAAKISNEIKDNVTYSDPKHYGAQFESKEDRGTGHISVLAPDGSAVAVTSTINDYLGAKLVSSSTGIIFNNQMDDFSNPGIVNMYGLHYAPNNCVEPRKRPFSSTSPTIITDKDGKARLIVGGSGGSRITTSVATVIMFNLFRNYTIKEAIDLRRLHHQLLPMEVSDEKGVSKEILDYLKKSGHKISSFIAMDSSVTAISRENGKIFAYGDHRKFARQAGF